MILTLSAIFKGKQKVLLNPIVLFCARTIFAEHPYDIRKLKDSDSDDVDIY